MVLLSVFFVVITEQISISHALSWK